MGNETIFWDGLTADRHKDNQYNSGHSHRHKFPLVSMSAFVPLVTVL